VKEKLFTPKEIAVALHNTALMTQASKVGRISEPRMRRLREYTEALLEPVREHLGEELLRPEELVFVLTTAALIVQQLHVLGTDKLPLGGDKSKVVA
jgi:hypothetical protein